MNKIKLLDRFVIDQITAGETVQRPASCLKELLENSIDAGSSVIVVAFEGAGSILLEVKDNGFGMSAEDAVKCIERHATSKISAVADLYNLRTLGFRGEALASIAAVSKMEIRTCERNADIGTLVCVEGGVITNVESCVCPQGTDIKVKDLFYNIPVRRNFLKSDRTEIKNLVQIFIRVALANTHVSFTVINNHSVLFDLKAETLKSRIDRVFGGKMVKKLSEATKQEVVSSEQENREEERDGEDALFSNREKRKIPSSSLKADGGKFRLNNETYIRDFVDLKIDTDIVKITGFVSKPEKCHKMSEQYFFVNARFMHNPYFTKAVLNAYTGIIQEGYQPSFFIYLDVPCDSIEVNIHPQKTEIKFRDDVMIFQILQAGVREAIGKSGFFSVMDFSKSHHEYSTYSDLSTNISPSHYIDFLKNRKNDYNPFKQHGNANEERMPAHAVANNNNEVDSRLADDALFEVINTNEVIEISESAETLQLGDEFILFTAQDRLFVVDRSNAELCIYFYQFMEQIKNENGLSQKLLFPAFVNIPTSDILLLDYLKGELEHVGFEIKQSEETNTFEILSCPILLANQALGDVLLHVIAKMKECEYTIKEVMDRQLSLILAEEITKKQKTYLTHEERLAMLRHLFHLPSFTYTPNGKRVFRAIEETYLLKFLQNVQK